MTAKAVQFTIYVKHQGEADEQAWKERYHEVVDEPKQWAKDLIKHFNATRRPTESKRVLVRVKVKHNKMKLAHDWHKTNLVTIVKGSTMYDTYRCTRCGVTGRRYGVREVAPDRGAARHCGRRT